MFTTEPENKKAIQRLVRKDIMEAELPGQLPLVTVAMMDTFKTDYTSKLQCHTCFQNPFPVDFSSRSKALATILRFWEMSESPRKPL